MVTERRRSVGRNAHAGDALERRALPRQSQHFRGLPSVATRELEVNARLDLAALKTAHQRAAKFVHRDAHESIPQRLLSPFLEFSPRVQMKGQPVESSQNIHDQ